jgi:hypothetical protein
MPHQQIIPTWLAWNNANFTSESGLTDMRTQQPFQAGGLGLGDFFDATEKEANSCSFAGNLPSQTPPSGLLHSGRYRMVQVDSAATAANVRTGTIGYIRIGTTLQGVSISAPGAGGTPGTYVVPIPAGTAGGTGASLQILVAANGTVTNAVVLQSGFGFSGPQSALAFTPTAGAIPGMTTQPTFQLMLNTTPNLVTSIDQANTQFGAVPPRPVVFLNSITPGNFGFIQELGVATLLASAAITPGQVIIPVVGTGLVSSGAIGPTALAVSVDAAPAANLLFKAILQYVPIVQD